MVPIFAQFGDEIGYQCLLYLLHTPVWKLAAVINNNDFVQSGRKAEAFEILFKNQPLFI